MAKIFKIAIIYDSKSGNTAKMAQAVKEGVEEEEGVTAYIKKVDQAKAADLLQTEAVIVGTPTHCGLLTWKLKKFFDENTGAAWNKVSGKIGAAFSTAGGLGGGNEMALLSVLNVLMNYGYLVFGLPDYAAPEVTAHYGAVAIKEPGEAELKSCRILGKRTASYVKKIN